MSKWATRQIATAAIIAALYTVMSLLSSIFGLTYGPIQCRFSEALTVLPFFLPEAVPGLFVGCLVTNLMSTVGPLDIIFGSMATLLAALWTAKMPNKFLATLPPVICNAVIIGAMIAWYVRLQCPDGGHRRGHRLLCAGTAPAGGHAPDPCPAGTAGSPVKPACKKNPL